MSPKNTTEKHNSFNSTEKGNKSLLEKREDEEVKEAAGQIEGAYVETVGTAESAEISREVSESMGETREKRGAGKPAKKIKPSKTDPAQIKAQLLRNIPSEKVMRKEIEAEIKKEIRYLHKRALKMLNSPGKINYFEMNNILKKIRELKGILKALLKSSLDSLKTLWLRFVHGIM